MEIAEGEERTFQRSEIKYLLDREADTQLRQELRPYLVSGEYPRETVISVYYDTGAHELISRSLEKPDFKEKLRLRSYGTPREDTIVYAEIKRKVDRIVAKRRIGLTLADARKFLGTGRAPADSDLIAKEIAWFLARYQPVPQIVLAYERESYLAADDPQLRITFDQNIRYRETELDLALGPAGKLLYPEGREVLEIKPVGAMPYWLTKILSRCRAYPSSFSKYGRSYALEHARNPGISPLGAAVNEPGSANQYSAV